MKDKRKQSVYMPSDMLEELQSHAKRIDRSISWVMQHAWKVAKTEINKFPSVPQ